jgi:adenosylhomocysteine nucleosidase
MVPDPAEAKMRIAFIAADRMEFPRFLKRATAVKPSPLPVDWAREVTLGGHECLLAVNGVGPARAAAAAKAAIETFRPDAVVSTGFCGALSPALGIADLVSANCVVGDGVNFVAKTLPGVLDGSIRSVTYVAATAQQKRELAANGAIAVEMEAAGVAAETIQQSLPFYCIRAVTDLAGETMANDFNMALRPDGHFDTMRILREALHRPSTRLPELLRLRERCNRAAGALGDFFADSRF